ncbi:hypothetical protein CR513_32792, partial [Mucuna pruriens]
MGINPLQKALGQKLVLYSMRSLRRDPYSCRIYDEDNKVMVSHHKGGVGLTKGNRLESPSVGKSDQSNHFKTTRKVFALSGAKASEPKNLVKVCLPPSQLDIIHSMDWLSTNHVLINHSDKIVVVRTLVMGKDERFITTNEAKAFLKEKTQAYMLLSSLKVDRSMIVGDVAIMREFLGVFFEDMSSLIRVKSEDVLKTTFRTHYSHYEYMTREEHVEHLRVVLQVLKDKYSLPKDEKVLFQVKL